MSSSSLTLTDFELLKIIGKGYTGVVYLALDKLSREPVALKIVKKGQTDDCRTLLEQEVQRSLSDSSFILPLLASWHDANNFYLVSPFYGGHDLQINLAVQGLFKEDRARFYATELLVALEDMKAKKVLHRDIKPANIVFTPQGHIRLIDFGFATPLKASPITDFEFNVDPNACSGSFKIHDPDFTSAERVGTPAYMSADQHIGRPYSYEADLHSLGVTIYQMLTGRLPFGEGAKSRDEMFEAVLCQHLTFRPEDRISSEARDLLSRLLERDSKRPAQLDDVLKHPWFTGVRWDHVRAQTTSPSWKPHLSPLPKTTTSLCVVNEGTPCLPDPYSNFNYVSPHFASLRARGEGGIFKRFSKLFYRDQSPPPTAVPPSTSSPDPSASPSEVPTEALPLLSRPASSITVVSSASSDVSSKTNPPPTPPPSIPLPPLPTVAPESSPFSSQPPSIHSPAARGDLPSLHVRQQLAKRAPAPLKARPIRADMTLMPQVTITPADNEIDVEEIPTDAPSVLRVPLGDITNQRLLSPSDAERPAFNPVLKPGPRIKLSAPPKRAKRAQKENACPALQLSPSSVPQAQQKTKVARTPPTAVFMLPPKSVPLPLVLPASAPLQTPSKAAAKQKNTSKQPLGSKTSPPKPATPKVKPAFKVPAKVTESKLGTPRNSVRRRNSLAKTPAVPASPVSTFFVELVNQEAAFPRPLARAESLSHPALAFIDSKEKPADYPRPPESVTQSRKLAPTLKPLSIEEAFAPPPASPPRPKATSKNATPAPTFTSTPQACGALNLSSAALSKESLAGFYGLLSPRINLDPQELRQRTGEIIERARFDMKTMQDGSHLSARAASAPIKVGPHYAGYVPGPSPTGIVSELRRLWIRLSMAVSRAISWLRYRGEPDFNRL
ncbi:hypothetical protein C0995_006895 [Termitomyces sp. Mi166|nr:hypothetical protein C0995_006895 [Termitomyces sp. Mi166\